MSYTCRDKHTWDKIVAKPFRAGHTEGEHRLRYLLSGVMTRQSKETVPAMSQVRSSSLF